MKYTHWNEGGEYKKKSPKGGADAKNASSKQRRYMLAKSQGGGKLRHQAKSVSIKEFVEQSRHATDCDCIFVPASLAGRPAKVSFCGKTIAAARYMCLLTHGTPKYEKAVTRHLCGNGHLSCVNPNHVVWGDTSDNQSDASKHRAAGDNVQDRINSV